MDLNKKIYIFRFALIATALFLYSCIFSQDLTPIKLNNGSLEGTPRAGVAGGTAPVGWIDCSHDFQSSVDIQPGFFNVEKLPQDGKSYLGMVVRADESWEGISQRLRVPLKPKSCYNFSIHLARSDIYLSRTRTSTREENFSNPAKLRIYGGNNYCSKNELLAESPLIAHEEWKQYDFRFEPISKHTYIYFEIFYRTPTLFPYNGNILLDNLSDIIPISCDEEEIIQKQINPPIVNILAPIEDGLQVETSTFSFKANFANVPSRKYITFLVNGNEHSFNYNSSSKTVTAAINLRKQKNVIQIIASTSDGSSQETRKVFYNPPPEPVAKIFEPKVLTELADRSKMQLGKVLPLTNVFFLADSIRIEKENYHILNELKDFLVSNPDVNIEIMGHTNNRCDATFCNSLSEKRARSVVQYLIQNGIADRRLTFKGYGKSKPIASNDSSAGRQKNQRVEVKITKISS